jgi:hypothetical protein
MASRVLAVSVPHFFGNPICLFNRYPTLDYNVHPRMNHIRPDILGSQVMNPQ